MTSARRLFGTDGIRDQATGPRLTDDVVYRVARAAARVVAGSNPTPRTALLGRDPRLSGPRLTAAVAAGWADEGLLVSDLGVLPTPALAGAARARGASLAAMITASHNPPGDNGLKFFDHRGRKLTDAIEAAIEDEAARLPPLAAPPAAVLQMAEGAAQSYIAHLARVLPTGALQGWRIAVDTAHGATCRTTPAVLTAAGAEVVALAGEPDGERINVGCGSEHPAGLVAALKASGARLGLAHDGDGDRVLVVDETGAVVDGDVLLALLALDALAQGRLPGRTLVATVQSNLGLDAALAAAGARVERTAVGDRHVAERLFSAGFSLGGEASGHVIFAEESGSGDGLLTALHLLRLLLADGRPLSVLSRSIRLFPQRTRNLPAPVQPPLESLVQLTVARREADVALADRGRVLIRYSGTEPKLRLLVEAEDEALCAQWLDRLSAAATLDLAAAARA